MNTLVKIYRYLVDGEWVAFITVLEGLALGLGEVTDILPDGQAKAYAVAGVLALGALVARMRVWSIRTLDRLKGS